MWYTVTLTGIKIRTRKTRGTHPPLYYTKYIYFEVYILKYGDTAKNPRGEKVVFQKNEKKGYLPGE